VFIPRGIELPCLDQEKKWSFDPTNFKQGDLITGGDVLGTVRENTLFTDHKILASPKISGRVVEMQPKGMYTVSQPVCTVETQAGK
jgi:vacuolar-type H+-ATPase catalytic subunit A/Vma1